MCGLSHSRLLRLRKCAVTSCYPTCEHLSVCIEVVGFSFVSDLLVLSSLTIGFEVEPLLISCVIIVRVVNRQSFVIFAPLLFTK